jgi:branched-chain amino acid transport system permease protein
MVGLAQVFAGVYMEANFDFLGAGFATIVPYLLMMVVLLIKPYGLFGTVEIRRV